MRTQSAAHGRCNGRSRPSILRSVRAHSVRHGHTLMNKCRDKHCLSADEQCSPLRFEKHNGTDGSGGQLGRGGAVPLTQDPRSTRGLSLGGRPESPSSSQPLTFSSLYHDFCLCQPPKFVFSAIRVPQSGAGHKFLFFHSVLEPIKRYTLFY